MDKIALAIAVIALLLSGVALTGHAPKLGAATTGNVTNYTSLAIDNGNLTFAVPTTGTSTIATLGCLEMYATSTATKVKLVFSPAGATSTFSGTAYFNYGTCP